MNIENQKNLEWAENVQEMSSYFNRMGQKYFAHQGVTKTGKPKYFASKKSQGAMAKLPDGFVFGESINGIVTIQRPKPMHVPEADLDLVKQKVAEFQHLKHYRVEAKEKSILIYEPMGMDSVEALAKLNAYSMLDSLKSMLGPRFEDFLAKTAKDMGISVSDLKRADVHAAEEKRKKSAEHLLRNIQYDSVMRFILDPILGSYHIERRCYRGDDHWAALGWGPLEKMLKKYVRHIGKESFFELI